jgi:mannose/fructose/sorbose-specific phosphotransferase system IIA component
MVGVLILTHGKLADGLKNSVEMIMGQNESFNTLGLYEGDDFSEFKENVLEHISLLDTGEGVLVLVDLFGASPYNSVMFNYQEIKSREKNVRLITGVNLPMVIESLNARNYMKLDQLYEEVMNMGISNIKGFKGEF